MPRALAACSCVSPAKQRQAKFIGFLARALQLPRTALRFSLEALTNRHMANWTATRARGGAGALTGFLMGGPLGAGVGAGFELLGRGAAKMARRMMRDPDMDMLNRLIRQAVREEDQLLLMQARQAFEQFGPTAFRRSGSGRVPRWRLCP